MEFMGQMGSASEVVVSMATMPAATMWVIVSITLSAAVVAMVIRAHSVVSRAMVSIVTTLR